MEVQSWWDTFVEYDYRYCVQNRVQIVILYTRWRYSKTLHTRIIIMLYNGSAVGIDLNPRNSIPTALPPFSSRDTRCLYESEMNYSDTKVKRTILYNIDNILILRSGITTYLYYITKHFPAHIIADIERILDGNNGHFVPTIKAVEKLPPLQDGEPRRAGGDNLKEPEEMDPESLKDYIYINIYLQQRSVHICWIIGTDV